MEIKAIQVIPLKTPLPKPIITNMHTLTHMHCLAVIIDTTTNIKGYSLIYGLGKISPTIIRDHILHTLFPVIQAKKCPRSLEDWAPLWKSFSLSVDPIQRYSLAAIDIAMCDMIAKNNNLSLHALLGGKEISFPAYGTTGWLSLNGAELIAECSFYAKKGINGFKVRLGHREDRKRIKLLREFFGDKFILMADANQRYNLPDAVNVARNLTEYNLAWLEEPIKESKIKDLKFLRIKSAIPIALGENIFDFAEFEEICRSNIDIILQADILRCGGITGFLKVAKMSEKHNLPFCNHLMAELSAGLVASCKTGYLIEYDNLLPIDLYTFDFAVKDGRIEIPNAPGTGVEVAEAALKKYSF
jgi:L-alanine-DL-glutamate epimerase-like enolase superfamily enzyme